MARTAGARTVRAPHGVELTCRGWAQEAALRMLMNNLDPDVAERPDDLVVYGGNGRAARSWQDFDAIVATLRELADDETMLVQSGRPVAVFRTHEWAPRVLISNAMIVPEWATLEEFRRLEDAGLTMFGQMTAGSWAYIGSQGILQSTYETFSAVASKRFGGTLAGTLTVTAGLGGMGGAQPLAIAMNGGVALCLEVDQDKIDRRMRLGYLDTQAEDLDSALSLALAAREQKRALSIGLLANAAEVLPQIVARDVPVDIATDQTSAHDPLLYAVPDLSPEDAADMRVHDPKTYVLHARAAMADHVEALCALLDRGAEVFEYGNGIRVEADLGGFKRALDFPGFIVAYIRPLFCEAKGHCRWIALSGDPADIATIDAAMLEEFADNRSVTRWLRLAARHVRVQGLPARTCMLGYGERARAGKLINDLVRDGKVSAPVAIGREHLDSGSVASPYRETEAMIDGSDAIADWPVLNAMLNTASGATWVGVQHGGGTGVGRSVHTGMVVVADGTPQAALRVDRVMTNDPGSGVVRHADAGYQRAVEFAAEQGIRMPSLDAAAAREGHGTGEGT
ncbi:urocanate hydratase [Actinomadura chibensis]|uniref:Urocanate hydratase n=1 Tax=Actinomadura chibensis TaxID=392828 RepID=A0A5D0NMX1_9ACTN|nr:urocanate hydratase [Actinomadura chibensis]TYB45474.1 urocanate hydratase [Actinomadura chibensis]